MTSRHTSSYVIVDLEATCWRTGTTPARQEIIEIGAVRLDGRKWKVRDEFAAFVRPVAEPSLSDFCTELTSITQQDVDGAEPFPAVFAGFVEWIGEEPFTLLSWGGYDLKQFRADCERHGVALPASFENHLNLKQAFARVYRTKPMGMKGALAHLGLPLAGTHHRGIDDARNIARIAREVLPKLAGMGG